MPEYALDPAWSPDGRFVIYSGPDIGTTFSVKAVTREATAYPLPLGTLTRGARHVAFLSGGRTLVLRRGEIHHKNLWLIDLQTGIVDRSPLCQRISRFATSISPRTGVKSSWNECKSARMWCSSIYLDHSRYRIASSAAILPVVKLQ